MSKISPARVAAFEILKRIEKERSFSSVLLPIYEENLTPVDRALCHELVLGILRKQIFLDKLIEKLTKKNSEKFDLEVILSLRLGIYQLLFLDKIPAYSAINESVNLVHKAKKRSASGLVNAVLRKVSRKENLDLKFADEIERISVETSHPRWLIENWIEQFGIEETKKIAKANNEPPNSAFRFTRKFYRRDAETQREILNLLDELELKKSEIVGDCFIVERSNEKLRELAETGLIYFQEEGSQLIGKVVNLQQDESFFDVCAAPGSKTTFVSSKFKVQSSKLFVAGDLYEQRVRFLRENCLNQGADFVEFLQYDAEKSLPFADESFDVVLIDAPCSGTGTIRHNPEIRYFLQEKDFEELSHKQLKILHNASKTIRRGGRLIYSTCSLEIRENEEVIEKFLKQNSELEKVLPELEKKFATEKGFARTFPNRDKIDGFFISVFKKK
jgi:16S rRNA (cytosine967-C5)-methyltransferase